ncbi:MAG: hypothetical protein BJ554DRAFT_3585, partial [Olpidium bornovanus]
MARALAAGDASDDGVQDVPLFPPERPTAPSSVRVDQLPSVDTSKRGTTLGSSDSSPTPPLFAASASFQGAHVGVAVARQPKAGGLEPFVYYSSG